MGVAHRVALSGMMMVFLTHCHSLLNSASIAAWSGVPSFWIASLLAVVMAMSVVYEEMHQRTG